MLRLGSVANAKCGSNVGNCESRGRAICLDVDWGIFAFRIVSAHLYTGAEKNMYSSTLYDVRYFCNSDKILVFGSNTQDALGPRREEDPPGVIGDFALDGRGWEGKMFIELLVELDGVVDNALKVNP